MAVLRLRTHVSIDDHWGVAKTLGGHSPPIGTHRTSAMTTKHPMWAADNNHHCPDIIGSDVPTSSQNRVGVVAPKNHNQEGRERLWGVPGRTLNYVMGIITRGNSHLY